MKIAALLSVIVGVAALIAFAALRNDSGNDGNTRSETGATPLPAAVQFTSPADGATVRNPVQVTMAIGGLRFAPESDPPQAGTGHLHVIIDGDAPPAGQPVPADATHLNLAVGFKVVLPELAPGPHALVALFTPSNNIFTNPALQDTIHITVTQ